MKRRRDIQGLRAVAIFSVVLFHSGLYVFQGYLGVDIFFTISGFVITGALLTSYDSSSKPLNSMALFYKKRFIRILPALAITVSVTTIFSAILLPFYSGAKAATETGFSAILSLANFTISKNSQDYFGPAAETNPLLHTWSLSVEEQIYLIFPALIWLSFSKVKQKIEINRALFIISIPVIASIILDYWSNHLINFEDEISEYFNPLFRFWEFGIGILAYLITKFLSKTHSRMNWFIPLAGLIFICFSFVGEGITTIPVELLATLGTALILIGGAKSNNFISALLGSRPFVYIGGISYSWYLWHWPFIVFAIFLFPESQLAIVISVLCSLCVAYASKTWVEDPLRFRWPKSKFKSIFIGSLVILIPLSVSLCSFIYSLSQHNQKFLSVDVVAEKPLGARNGCFIENLENANSKKTLNECNLHSTINESSPIYLLGDSNADHFSDGLAIAANNLERNLYSRTASGCPFPSLNMIGFRDSEKCNLFNQETLKELRKLRPGTVIISNTDVYLRDSRISISENNEKYISTSQKTDIYINKLESQTQDLLELGFQIYVVQTIPNFWDFKETPNEYLRHCFVNQKTQNDCSPYRENKSEIISRQKNIWSAVQKLAHKQKTITVIDFANELCPTEVCSYGRPGNWIYRDANHISINSSEALSDEWVLYLADNQN